MTKKKRLQIVRVPRWSWKKRLALYISVFGGVWLFLEPVFVFSLGSGLLTSLGILGYISLVFLCAVPVLVGEQTSRRRVLGNVSFIAIEVILTKSGSRLSVDAPQDMLVEEFVELFLREVGKLAPLDSKVISLYKNNLLVDRGGNYVEVPDRKTLREAGLSDGDICKIRGYIRIEYVLNLLSISYSMHVARVSEARAKGKVFLDEDVAFSVESALERGVINKDMASQIEKWSRIERWRGSTEVFIVDNRDTPL